MANGKIRFGKQSGGQLALVIPDGVANTEVVVPESGTLVSVGTTVTDNAIVRFDGTTGAVQNSSVTIDDSGLITGSLNGNASTASYAVKAKELVQVSNFPTADNQDFNTLMAGGVYNIVSGNYAGTLNAPPNAFSYGTMFVEHGANFITQKYSCLYGQEFNRTYYNGVWQPWKTSVKVSSLVGTTNTVPRFDGTTGSLKNSSVTIDDSGNVAVGVTPSPWSNIYKNIEIGTASSFGNCDVGGFLLTQLRSNAYENNGWKYKQNGYASMYEQYTGLHSWSTASSGIAGNPIAWTTAMTLTANGNLLVGTTTDNGVDKLQVNGSISSGEINVYNSGDLNDFKYITQTIGTYPYMLNIPVIDHGYLEVIVYNEGWVLQRFTCLGTVTGYAGRTFVRCFTWGTTWTPWVEK